MHTLGVSDALERRCKASTAPTAPTPPMNQPPTTPRRRWLQRSLAALGGSVVALGLGTTLVLTGGCESEKATRAPVDATASTVFLVRHAEKATADGGEDPPLTEAGLQRARALVEALPVDQISTIYTTPFVRTRETAAPVAEAAQLEPTLVDPADIEGLVRMLERTPRGSAALVVGHSNTLPPILEGLGVDRPEIADDQYGDLFVVRLDEDGAATLQRRHFGD